MTGNSRDSIKKIKSDLENDPLILTPPVLDFQPKEGGDKIIRILSKYEPIKPCPSPEKIESEGSTTEFYHLKYKIVTRENPTL
jgi:hypothetical protein